MQTIPGATIIPLYGHSYRRPGRSDELVSELDDIDALVLQYRARLVRYVAFSTGEADLAESIAHDSLLKAYQARASFRGDCAVSTWLFSIANHMVLDHLRLRKFQFWRKIEKASVDIGDIASLRSSGEKSPEDLLLIQERAKQVQLALDILSVNQRRIFILRFLEDMEVSEIAQATGMARNTVKTHLNRAVKAVRAQLGGEK